MSKFIILALLVVLANCAARNNKKAEILSLAQIDKDHFGSTFISAIAMNLAAEAPFEEVIIFVNQIINGIQSDQATADEINRATVAECDKTIAGFNAQIVEQTNTIAQLTNAIKENSEILQQAKIDLDQANKDYAETVMAIETGTAERAEDHNRWADDDYRQSIQIATLEEGIKLIQHMLHGIAFSQIKSRYEKVMDKLKQADDKHATLYKPLITALTQLATKLNYENVMKILELLGNIRASIAEEQEQARQAENRAQADWEVLLQHLENQKQSLADKRARLAALISNTEALLEQMRASLEGHKIELENVQQSLASTTKYCEEQAAVYATLTAERTRQLEVLNALLQHLNEKAAGFSELVASRQ